MNTTYRKNLKAVLTASKNYTDNSIEKLKWELGTYDLSITTDSTVAYTKTIPTNTIKGRLNYIGGASKVSENLAVFNDNTQTISDVTFTRVNGVVTMNGTASSSINYNIVFTNSIDVGTYSLNRFNNFTNSGVIAYLMQDDYTAQPSTYQTLDSQNKSVSFTSSKKIIRMIISISSGTVLNNVQIKPMLVKGSTAPTEFSVGFEGIRSAKTTSVVISGTDVAPITKAIPSEIQALEGYGQSNPEDSTKFNYIDFDKKIYVELGHIDENDEWQELATPIETDISQYIDDDFKNIDTTNMGTITFENEFGYAVPSEIDYLIEEVKA